MDEDDKRNDILIHEQGRLKFFSQQSDSHQK